MMAVKAAGMKGSIMVLFCAVHLMHLSRGTSLETETWPQHHKNYSVRPTPDSYCEAGVIPFCPTGISANTMPQFPNTDTLYVYAMKAPVWEFKFGSLLKKFNIMHDAVGFHHVQSGLNLTMEWYELFQLFNCTFPHEPQTNKLLWCNQGATCAYAGIDRKHWEENGTLVKVAEISGEIFNSFAQWTETDNATYPFYETWTVRQSPGGPFWFYPFDCASWVQRAFAKMKDFGATFNHSVHLNYTKINLFSKEPKRLGNYSEIFESKENEKIREKLVRFYANFQKESNFLETLEHLMKSVFEFLIDGSFYLYYNDIYWDLPLTEPYVALTYDEIPLP